MIFNIQQRVIDGLEYLEENQRELVIWGIPLFGNHQVEFHPDYTPSLEVCNLINLEMDLVEKDFQTTISHWRSLKSMVDRHLDVVSDLPRFMQDFMSMLVLAKFTDRSRYVVQLINSVF